MENKGLQPKTSLIEMAARWRYLMDRIEDMEGELTPEVEEDLSGVDLAIPKKADGYGYVLDQCEMNSGYWRKRAEQCLRIARTLDRLQDRIKNNIKLAMGLMKTNEIKGVDLRFKLQNGAKKLVILQESLPKEYLMQKVEWVPDRERIKKDLEAGVPIEGAKLEPTQVLRSYPNKG